MKKFSWLISLAVIPFFSACDETQTDLQVNLETASEYVLGEVTYLDIFNYIDKALQDSLLLAQGSATIDSAQVSLSNGGLTALLDFGTGVTCPDGKIRSGSISINLSAPYIQDTTSANAMLNSYTVDGRVIAGNLLIVKDFSGINKDLSVEVTGGSYSDTLGNTSTWQSLHSLRWTAGTLTPGDLSDDAYSILAGSTASGTAYNGQGFSSNVTSDLLFAQPCKYINQGVLAITLPGALVENGTIDFGTGECDNKVTFNFGGSSFPYYID